METPDCRKNILIRRLILRSFSSQGNRDVVITHFILKIICNTLQTNNAHKNKIYFQLNTEANMEKEYKLNGLNLELKGA